MRDQTSNYSITGAPSPVVPDQAESDFLPSRIKLQAVIGAERFILPVILAGLLAFGIGLVLGPGRKSFGMISHETSWMISFGLGGALVMAATLLWLIMDNYYLIDKNSRRILMHKGFRFFGTDFPFLDGGQVAAIGLNCRPRKGKYGQIGWAYTPVLLTKDGQEIALSSWLTTMNCGMLPDYNEKVRQWAAALQCYWIECPPNLGFEARQQFDNSRRGLELKMD